VHVLQGERPMAAQNRLAQVPLDRDSGRLRAACAELK